MRTAWSALLVAGVGAIAVAALVDSLVRSPGRRSNRQASATASAPESVARLPACAPGQLALELEMLGGETSVVVRHVDGPPCHRSPLTLTATVTNSRGARSEIPLGDAGVIRGDFSPGFEQLIGLTYCGTAPPFVVEARAGPYRVRGPAPLGWRCDSTQQEVSVEFDAPPAVRRFTVFPLDTTTHETSFLIALPRRTDVSVGVRTARGLYLTVLDAPRRADCRKVGSRESCLIRFGLLGEGFRGPWTIVVRKASRGPAHISFSIAFVATSA